MDKATKQWLNDVPWPKLPRYDEEAFMHLKRPKVLPFIILYYFGVVVITLLALTHQGVLTVSLLTLGTTWNVLCIVLMHRQIKRRTAYDKARAAYDPSHWG